MGTGDRGLGTREIGGSLPPRSSPTGFRSPPQRGTPPQRPRPSIPSPQSPVPSPQYKKRRIIGIDPGLAATGWGVVDYTRGRIRYVDHGSIETKAGRPQAERLFCIMESLRSILDTYQPVEAAVETLYFGRNVSSAIPVAEARGVIFAVLAEHGLAVREFRPNAIKQGVTGVANADKKQVQELVRIMLGLVEIPAPDHAADALGAAICAANS